MLTKSRCRGFLVTIALFAAMSLSLSPEAGGRSRLMPGTRSAWVLLFEGEGTAHQEARELFYLKDGNKKLWAKKYRLLFVSDAAAVQQDEGKNRASEFLDKPFPRTGEIDATDLQKVVADKFGVRLLIKDEKKKLAGNASIEPGTIREAITELCRKSEVSVIAVIGPISTDTNDAPPVFTLLVEE